MCVAECIRVTVGLFYSLVAYKEHHNQRENPFCLLVRLATFIPLRAQMD